MLKIKKVLSMVLACTMTLGLSSNAFAANSENIQSQVVDSITIPLNNESNMRADNSNVDVVNFFDNNDIDYEYYMDWLSEQEQENLSSVTISVSENQYYPSTYSNSDIRGSRLVYADRNYRYTEKENPFSTGQLMANAVAEAVNLTIGKYTQFVASLSSILGIANPSTYFGTDRVREGEDYYVNDGANRVVTKFVELYAPVSGTTKWYPWGYAEGDYVRHGVQLYYKGLEQGAKKNIYHQYYTENYYNHTNLINKVKDAYPRRTYTEVADDYAATTGGYDLRDRSITRSQYLEYDHLVQ